MFPIPILNCESIRIPLKTGQDTYFFRTAGALTSERIAAITIPHGANSPGSFPDGETVIDPSQVYISLVDIDGNVLYSNIPGSQFSANSLNYPAIDRVIDWERSYIKVSGTPQYLILDDTVFTCNVFTRSAASAKQPRLNYYAIDLPVVAGQTNHIEFTNRLQALRGRNIYGVALPVYAFSQTQQNPYTGTISLYSTDESRFIDRAFLDNFRMSDLSFVPDPEIRTILSHRSLGMFIEPTPIDFERSYMNVYIPETTLNLITIILIYE